MEKVKGTTISKTIQLSGIISFEYGDGFNKIKLIQEDGYKIDLVGRFIEIDETYIASLFQVNYWLADKPCTKNEIVEMLIHKVVGGVVKAEYEKYDVQYSSWTSDTIYNTHFRVGNHDLMKELSDKKGKFIIIEINVTA